MDVIKTTDIMKFDDDDDNNEQIQVDFINSLNNECLIKIFMKLSIFERLQIEKVCERWNYLSQLIWCDINEFNCNSLADVDKDYFLNQAEVSLLLQRCGIYLTKLVISSVCDSSIMSYVREYCLNVNYLELNLSNINESDFVGAFSTLKQLKIIKIKEHKFETRNTLGNQPKILNSLPEDMIEIHILSSGIDVPLSIQFLSSLEKFHSLSSLTLRHFVLDSITMNEINQKNTLIYLDLSRCRLKNPFVISNCTNLKDLILECVTVIDTVCTASIAVGCKNLKYLNMTNCSIVTKDTLQELSKLKNLEKLIISNVFMADDTMFDQFFKLKYLDCFGCYDITDDGLKKVLKNCYMLEYLDATDTGATVETIKTAVIMTKYRQNDIVLQIILGFLIVEQYSVETIETSNYLKILPSKDDNISLSEFGEPDNVVTYQGIWPDDDTFDDCVEVDDDGFELF